MATTPNTVGTHSDTLVSDDHAVVFPSWITAVTVHGITLHCSDDFSVSLYDFSGDIAWNIYDVVNRETAIIKWQYGKDAAYKLIYSIMRHDGVTSESLARLVREIRFLTS